MSWHKQMATECPFSKEDVRCPICGDIYTFPVTLSCQHNFCKACIQAHWERKQSQECSVCHRRASTRRPPVNLALKIASDTFKNQANRNLVKYDLCLIHKEELKLFCHKDGKTICTVCHSSRDHKDHECCPIAEAAADRKKELSKKYDALKKHLNSIKKMKGTLEELQGFIEIQSADAKAQMKEEFEMLHRFLREEEAARLMVLKEETTKKTQAVRKRLEDITQTFEELSEILDDIAHTMKKDDISFLKDCKEAIRRACYPTQEMQYTNDVLIDTAQYLGSLRFGVWKRMEEVVKHCPVTLDPTTAHPNLILSDELSSVCYGKKQQLPDNHERCSSRMAVLGSTGFTSGKHCWDVEVGESREWYIGVARQSIKRKTSVFLNPSEGFWVIGLNNGDSYWAQTSPRFRLALKKKPQRITVELDYEKGKVTFSNAADGSMIHAFKDRFTEKMFPYFAPGIHVDGQYPLKICPLKVSIMLQQDVQHS
ncbi:zinc-binding protein A33-like [Pygocentrus nattereri]|uniref:Zinc-binding protein A33-like n=1 Tax=Pygocentrus nattereri TaxID=42514 RepID=A0A3B4CAG5_PYGNA|nr:zinc-binding protein A33-like [Pygocentrus nattereri]